MASDEHVEQIDVVYALPERQHVVTLSYEPGESAAAAVERSGLLQRFPAICEGPLVLGVYGKPVANDYVVKAGDRVEICRPLERDPREMRKELWARGRVIGGKSAPDRRR